VRELTRYSTQMPPEAIRHSALRAFAHAAHAVSTGSLSAKQTRRKNVRCGCQPKGGWHVYRHDSTYNRVIWL